jgi:phosphoribosyl 1,2-cyclic phosphodiesterase
VRFRFWGVRGSLPCPLSPEALKAKISSVIQRVRPEDLTGPDARERFLAGLPPELFGLIGGNSTCLEVESDEREVLIVDGGTGIRDLGRAHETDRSGKHYHIFMTHFHWDHIQGFPFFAGFFNPRNRVTIYSPEAFCEDAIRRQMQDPYFPVPLSVLPAKLSFVTLGTEPLVVGGTKVEWKAVNHPGGCWSYRFERAGKTLVFSTDTELRVEDFERTDANLAFFGGTDVLVLDAQYTLDEAIERPDWGHSSSSMAVEFSLAFGVKTLYLFHHEPNHDDAKIEEIGRLAQWYADHKRPGVLEVVVAREGREERVR